MVMEGDERGSGNNLFPQNPDQPFRSLVMDPLTGDNYISWSRMMSIALEAMGKLGFVNGKCKQPQETSADYHQWKKEDAMVTYWILNSISKEIAGPFVFATSAKELWEELEDMYGNNSWPRYYQLQRELWSMKQADLSVANYFTKLKLLWGELAYLMPIPKCRCSSSKAVSEFDSNNKLMQFLMGLDDAYAGLREQILAMDPLPDILQAFFMVVGMERLIDVDDNRLLG